MFKDTPQQCNSNFEWICCRRDVYRYLKPKCSLISSLKHREQRWLDGLCWKKLAKRHRELCQTENWPSKGWLNNLGRTYCNIYFLNNTTNVVVLLRTFCRNDLLCRTQVNRYLLSLLKRWSILLMLHYLRTMKSHSNNVVFSGVLNLSCFVICRKCNGQATT